MGPPIWGRGAAVEMFPVAVRTIRPPPPHFGPGRSRGNDPTPL